MKRTVTLMGLVALVAGCEAVPVVDPANYYSASRYYDGKLITDRQLRAEAE